ncbi:acetyltransferase [Rhodococcus sp. IEGM 1408]|uniref:acetyltransferase n=1 Tax=Rhodococcus sp. IEGM 1408 TaxID=3082220 RepID=UPI002954D1C7|nr:acetyltransferase [Rhodococcus sp. IEGM 1408]MDV8003149.1 acetyltransferase [Rhodococcus sp. IEGM 1408]
MPTPLVIIGAGGFGREVLDIVHDLNRQLADSVSDRFDFIGFIDDGEPDMDRLSRIGAHYIGPSASLNDLPEGCEYSIGIGSGAIRRTLDDAATAAGLQPATLVHSSATFGADVHISPGAVVCAHVSVTTNVSIGRHAHINLNSTIGHDSVLADFSTVNPLCAISGEVTVGEEAMVGTNSAINQGLTIGRGSIIGSGSAVTKNVEDYTLVAGVPAVVKKMLPH